MLRLEGIHKRYGLKTVALKQIDLEIKPRELFVLYGPAGAGKSSVLNLIAGISKPTKGDIQFEGQSVVHLPPQKRNVAMAFENYALYSHLSVADNLGFPLRAQGMTALETRKRVEQIAGTLGIEKLLDRRPGFLSGGQRQRVALGRAIIRPASIYLLDEPIGHLDAKLRHHMRAEIKALAQELDAIVVFTTTSSREALALADRLAVINEGAIEQVGTPGELYHQPRNTFVGSFVGDPPMSFLSVNAKSHAGRVELISRGGTKLGHVDPELTGVSDLKVGVRAGSLKQIESSPNALTATVRVLERLGYADIAVADADGDEVSVMLPPQSGIKPGEKMYLGIEKNKLQLFQDNHALAQGVF